ncbi:hypothetical protein NUU61_006994 [Penicillium alfredii]|uniref:Lipase B n=1 Tax=Penicillium alfredii TaxID=1506179 RepID=A0A9W9F210_9EURO|nr:uncharacterized protein NUU61_006994 [Penicillium alfredii]KAJ5092124.1 hypothetical protein NUU61_006994 [Penicillium alfredii]
MRASLVLGASFAYGVIASPVTSRSAVTAPNLFTSLSNAIDNPDTEKGTSATMADIVSQLKQNPDKTPKSAHSALSTIEQIMSNGDASSIVDLARDITKAGLIPEDILSLLDGYLDSEINSLQNQNPVINKSIYPSVAGDAPYSIPEHKLRSAIYIPDSFSYGRDGKTPVLLVPGTGIPGGTTYYFSFSKLGKTTAADVVWVNLPRAALSDAQLNSEYVAYAIQYLSALCGGRSVAVIAWSQGNLNTQWALKYWPSTRKVVQDLVAMSPDFHGTVERYLVCPALALAVCTPSLWQQGWDTKFIQTLRTDDGDSAYVPTTTVYSSFDNIVQPMSGPNASARLGDVRNVGVTNAHLQTVCAGQPAGGFYTHDGVLYNPLAWALAIDAITHDGPASLSRINLAQVCQGILWPTLDLKDMLATEGLLLIAVMELLAYQPPALDEPPIKEYTKKK